MQRRGSFIVWAAAPWYCACCHCRALRPMCASGPASQGLVDQYLAALLAHDPGGSRWP